MIEKHYYQHYKSTAALLGVKTILVAVMKLCRLKLGDTGAVPLRAFDEDDDVTFFWQRTTRVKLNRNNVVTQRTELP